MSGVSRVFHNWARKEGMFHRGMQVGDILLNSWEGIYLDITEEKIIRMMDDIAAFGGELFVMDDGWFGDKYPRKEDNSSLGDWVIDRQKLPNGIKALTEAAKQRKIKFGIWIEPEMTNTVSELFDQHPDWVLQRPGRDLRKGRGGTQVVLDMTNPKVQDFVFSVVDNLMTQYPEISYIKWDANAPIQNYGSTYLPKSKQSRLRQPTNRRHKSLSRKSSSHKLKSRKSCNQPSQNFASGLTTTGKRSRPAGSQLTTMASTSHLKRHRAKR